MNTAMTPDTSAPASARPRSFARFAVPTARVLLGLVFFGAGLSYFLMPAPPADAMPGPAGAFAGALVKTGYMLTFIKATEVTCGLALLANRFVPLALTVLAPVVLNIVLLHAILMPSGLPVALLVLALELFLAWSYRDVFRPMLALRTPRA